MKKDFNLARVKRVLYYRVYQRTFRRPLRTWLKVLVAYDEMKALHKQSSSYRSSIKREKLREDLSSLGPAKRLESKEVAYRFAASENVPTLTSEVYQDVEGVIQKLRKSTTPQVVKPLVGHSSRDVFIVFTHEDIFDLGKRIRLDDIRLLESRLIAHQRKGWLIEPFLASTYDHRCPAHDLKFYSFYGEIGLVLEVCRYPEIRYCWWGADGINLGKAKRNQLLFQGSGFSKQEMEWAQEMSAQVPAPFIRVDFLKSDRGVFFSEFTPVPGPFDQFRYEVDEYLGRMYLEAEARLLKDLWDGKNFDNFRKVTAAR